MSVLVQTLLEILKLLIPTAAVFAASYYIVKKFLDNENKKREMDLRKSTQGMLTPIKLQAYERIVIFLERINPSALVLRTNKMGMSSSQLHRELIASIKAEYEHNLAQQIYMSHEAWGLIKTAKEEIIRTINIASTKVNDQASSQELAQLIIQLASGSDKLPNDLAIEFIKKEINASF